MRILASLLLVSAACGDGGGGSSSGAPDGSSAADGSGPDVPAGTPDIVVHQRSIDGSSIDASVFAAWWVTPLPDPYHVVSESGPCVLTAVAPYDCDGFCEAFCIDGECLPYPDGRPAGTLTVSGGEREVEATEADGTYSFYQGSPLFSAGDRVVATATGDQFPAFEVETRAVADLEVPGIDDLRLEAGEDFRIEWTPADAESRVRLRLESDQHGQYSPTVIECDVPDAAGAITVAGDMIREFWATPGQCGECATQNLVRYSRGVARAGDEMVLLEYASRVSFYPYSLRL
ncbi:MAG TPA: hypothetical protein VFU21_19335 [Kofleriaceae bacterium]|nr:hypothetical protein [Kofleriaceae bacterium]